VAAGLPRMTAISEMSQLLPFSAAFGTRRKLM
jgi:hypothetical protein